MINKKMLLAAIRLHDDMVREGEKELLPDFSKLIQTMTTKYLESFLEYTSEEIELLKTGFRVKAVVLHRNRTGKGLAEAKRFMEQHEFWNNRLTAAK